MRGFNEETKQDERDMRARKYVKDYVLRPGCENTRKADSYIYTGYYYSLDLEGTSLTFGQLRFIYILTAVLQMAAALAAGMVPSVMLGYSWTVWPYAIMLLFAGLGVVAIFEMIDCKEEFIRRTRDKGFDRFRTAQFLQVLPAGVLALTEIVFMLLNASGRNLGNVAFLLITLAVGASAYFMARFTGMHKPVIVRDGNDEYNELKKKYMEEMKMSAEVPEKDIEDYELQNALTDGSATDTVRTDAAGNAEDADDIEYTNTENE